MKSQFTPAMDPAQPTFAVLSDHASRIADLAEALARAGREDEGAAAELRRLAGTSRRWQRLLRESAQLFMVNGEHLEIRWRHRAVRLLNAAATGLLIVPEGADQRTRFELLERVSQLPPSLAFDELAAREPQLLALRNLLLAPVDAAGESRFTRWLRGSSVVHHELIALVGHARPGFDPLCSAVLAYAIATTHLTDLAAASSS